MRFVIIVAMIFLASMARADDWTGKTVRVKEDGLKLGRKLGGGLVRDGDSLDKTKTYTVKSDDGNILELPGGFVFRTDVAVAEQRKAIEMLKAEKTPDAEDLKKAEARLELYRAKKPYRDEE
jgi:hypothetical protein